MAIGKRIICLVMAVIFSLPVFMQPAFASEAASGQDDVYVGMIDISDFGHGSVSNLMNGSSFPSNSKGLGVLIYYNQNGTMMPMYCVEPGKALATGNNIVLSSYIKNLTNNTLIYNGDIQKMLGRLFLYAYTDKASSETEKMSQYFASQLLVWEIVVGERDEFFGHVNNPNGSNVTDVLQSMNSSVANKVKSYYDSYVTSIYGEYFYREFDAPKGYILDEKAYPFSIKENGKIVKCQMTNTKIPVVPETPVTPKPPVIPDTPVNSSPKTGDDSNVSIWIITICMALGVSMVTLKKKNIKEDTEYEND